MIPDPKLSSFLPGALALFLLNMLLVEFVLEQKFDPVQLPDKLVLE